MTNRNETAISTRVTRQMPANGKVMKWVLMLFFAFYTLFPLIWLIISSFKTNTELLAIRFPIARRVADRQLLNAFKVPVCSR